MAPIWRGEADLSDPLTIVVRRKVKPGREKDDEAWLERLTRGAAERFKGYRGAAFHRPAAQGGAYRSVFRFDSLESLDAFERSDYRATLLAEAAPRFAADAAWERMTGLEFWFDPPPGTQVPQPSPHRMALVLIAVVVTLVLILNVVLVPFMPGWPLPRRVLIPVTIQVMLMTYVIMPRLTPLIARFIYEPHRDRRRRFGLGHAASLCSSSVAS